MQVEHIPYSQSGQLDAASSGSDVQIWTGRIIKAVEEEKGILDGARDMGHLQRVTTLALRLVKAMGGNELVVTAAGWLHHIFKFPKGDPRFAQTSLFCADRSQEILSQIGFPDVLLENVHHSIHAASYLANIEATTIEAACIQDAESMESLGAFGLMRTFYSSGGFGSNIVNFDDPQAWSRKLDDSKVGYAADHFQIKLFKLEEKMKTEEGKKTAKLLTDFLREFHSELCKDNIERESTPQFKIAKIFHDAGKQNRPLYNHENPFGDNEVYALDAVIKSNDSYFKKFVEQLRFELNGYSTAF